MNLDVVYSSDDNYAQHVGVSMLSLFENNKDFYSINIYLIENNISIDNKNNLISICEKYNRIIKFINFDEYSNKLNLNMENHISINAYARLFLSKILEKSIGKIIYLDCDSIINGSLSSLWRLDISNYYVAGVCDTVSDNTKLKINLDLNKSYINSGMLLINLKKWREEDVEKKFLKFIELYNGNVFHHDQGVINGVLNEKILLLHPKYNAMTPFYTMDREQMMQYYGLKNYYIEDELVEAKRSPVFIHYTPAFVNRPWIKGCKHPLASLYKKYLDMTPWKGNKLGNDNRKKGEKLIAFLFNNFPFKIANGICNLMFK
ncbi:glycosyltransferase family 8 protein [Priestia megaterium]|nr:glycosyltransferase family 8 protein [Priestia megaterium]